MRLGEELLWTVLLNVRVTHPGPPSNVRVIVLFPIPPPPPPAPVILER